MELTKESYFFWAKLTKDLDTQFPDYLKNILQ